MNAFFVLLLSLSEFSFTDAGMKCLECNNLAQPLDCQHVRECGPHQICYVAKTNSSRGSIRYDVGCRSTQLCGTPSIVGKRVLDGHTACLECCNDRDICNFYGLCGSQIPHLPPGSKLCYDCPLAPSPDDCNQISLCDEDSACSISLQRNLVGDWRWKHLCTIKAQCASIAASSLQSCSYCCTDDLCNRNCTLPSSLVTTTTTISTTTTTTTTIKPLSVPIVTNVIMRPNQITYGDTVTVSCIATGNPTPTFDFLYKGASLAQNVKVTQGSNVLTITNYAQVNDGDYRCVATNRLGDSHRDMHLQGH